MVDTSAWVEYLRGTDSDCCKAVMSLLNEELIVSDPIRMEIFTGVKHELHLEKLNRLLARYQHVHAIPYDYEHAALLYRECRQHGETVRKMVDCLIAAIAIRSDYPLLHNDDDFKVLAKYTALSIYSIKK